MATVIEKSIRSLVGAGAVQLAAFNRSRMKPARNPFLEGIHRPVAQELTIESLEIQGSIPTELDGLYVRNGPNPLGPEHGPSHHWFLGDAMVHGVRLSEGRALWYRNRWVRSRKVSDALGEAQAPGRRDPRDDTANTNIIGIGERIFAIVEAGGHPVELSPDLETVSHNPFDGTLTGPFSAHPHVDPETGLSHAIAYEGAPQGHAFHVVVDSQARVVREERIAVSDGPSIHDCAITRNHILVFDLPVTFSMGRAIAGFRFPYGWNPDHGSRVGVLGLGAPGDTIRWCALAEPAYVFHAVNAFEAEDGRIVADVVVHDSMFARSTMGPDSRRITLERWTIDPTAGSVDRQRLSDTPQEFPRIDERRTGRPYRHCWTVGVDIDGAVLGESGDSRLFAHDLETGTSETRDFGSGRVVGEFVHVARGPDERDAWLIGYVLDRATDTTDLVILDAADVTGPAVATVRIPARIPPGFHGNWIPV
jgi:carotenoid cleavage dioxygenase-like enzyme